MDGALPCERRSLSRRPGNTIGPLQVKADGTAISAKVWDISIQGVGLLVDRQFEPGMPLTVLPGQSGRPLFENLVAHVRHARQLSKANWLLGCRFSRILTTNDMINLS